MSRSLSMVVMLVAAFAGSVWCAEDPSWHHAQGEMAGEVTPNSVLLQTRLTATGGLADGDVPGAPGQVRFEWSASRDFAVAGVTPSLPALSENDCIARVRLTGLHPATRYYYRVIHGAGDAPDAKGAVRSFKTLPGPASAVPVRFVMGSCMNYHPFMSGTSNGGGPVTATDEDRQMGYPAFEAMRRLEPDFFIGAGDIVYYDKPARPAAATLPELRQKWHEQFRFPRLVEFFGVTPAYWLKDDHDFRYNDADLGGSKDPSPELGIRVFREQLPILDAGDLVSPTYRTRRINRHLQLWFMEGRDYRAANRDPDAPGKSLWGATQMEWLRQGMAESDATWKVIVSPTPMVGPDDASKRDNHANPGGFKSEADAFFEWLAVRGLRRVLVFCGDRHWQYHSIHPSGVEEFACGALNDENSRVGVKPGSQKGTDPEGRIRQVYTYAEPTGGFMMVSAGGEGEGGATFSVTFHDDRGAELYRHEKR